MHDDKAEKETTRFYELANLNFLRVALKDHYVKDVLIRKGTLITNPDGSSLLLEVQQRPEFLQTQKMGKRMRQHPDLCDRRL